jgi:hypothetical protein
VLSGCGYVGDPLPPLANVPVPVADLAAIQRGAVIIAQFTIPTLTTESKPIPIPLTLDLRVGPNPSDHFEQDQWASGARHIVTPELTGPTASYRIPIAEWIGKEVLISVRVTAANGKQSPWSNIVILPVIAAPVTPSDVTPVAVAQGVRLTWRAAGGKRFRVLRKTEGGEFSALATVDAPEWTDTATEYGRRYTYLVQTLAPLENNKQAESELSAEASLTPADTFAPATPAGLRAEAAPASVELSWDRNTEIDLSGYRVYRATPGGAFEQIGGPTPTPAYSDRAAEHGKTYRYTVTAVDRAGNESPRANAIELVFP